MRQWIAASVVVATAGFATGAAAQDIGDPAAGEQVFNQCMACHAVGENAQNKIGPALNGVVGAKPGMHEDFSYSDGFQEWASDKEAWNADLLSTWLENPRAVVANTKMVYPGLTDEQDRKDVIAYLASFDESGAKRDPAEALSQ